MSDRKRILLITNAELGQANVYLAVGRELLSLQPDLDLHVASFASLSAAATALGTSDSPVTFHEIRGATWKEALFHRPEHRFEEVCSQHPTVWNAKEAAAIMPRIATPWNPDELVDLVQQTEKIISDVKADLVVVDNLFTPAITVCYKLKPKWHVLSPNSYREFILGNQPRLEALWKHPPPRSIIPYPTPLHLVPSAVYQLFQYVKNARSPWVVGHYEHMREAISTTYADWGMVSFKPPEGLKVLLPSRSEIEFPFSVVPPHIVSCGPIILPSRPLEELDAELAGWLAAKPTVYVNLGTHAYNDESDAVQLALSLRSLLGEAAKHDRKLQVLWKLRLRAEQQDSGIQAVKAALGANLEKSVRITDWLSVNPVSILESGSVICSVNHGGANSYYEAVSAGIPQVVLPVWFDTYDYATRVEYLRIGRLGSAKSAPKCSAQELGPILADVIFGESAPLIRKRAAELAGICRANGGGRVVAAKTILSEMYGVDTKTSARTQIQEVGSK